MKRAYGPAHLLSSSNHPTSPSIICITKITYPQEQNSDPLSNNINKTVLQMAYPTDQDYEKQIYVKNRNWNPPPALLLIENIITDFKKELKKNMQNFCTNTTKPTLVT